jgi:glycerophosphoryl diester phosphodiesterase
MSHIPLVLALVIAVAAPGIAAHAAEQESRRPLVIAHRGASGYLPEHTLEAYAMAYGQGADYIEPDLVLTKDGVFICLHDIHLEATTDVEQMFPERQRDDGRWYAADFTAQEIKSLRVHERLPGRFPKGKGAFEVPTFAEMAEMIQGLNAASGRAVGIYPELKAPAWHREQGLPMEEAFLKAAATLGYEGSDARIFVQCFEPEPLRRMRDLGSELPQVQLISDSDAYAPMLTAAGLAEVAEFAQGVGPNKGLIVADPALVQRAHDAGLAVHPWTFRKDQLPGRYDSFEAELRAFFEEYRVDGVFTDFPDTAVEVLDE